jgi:hypothetical protein
MDQAATLACSFHQLRLQRDLGSAQGLRDRASFLSNLSQPEEFLLSNTWDFSLSVQVDRGDFVAVADLTQVNRGRSVDAPRRVTRQCETQS